MKIWNWLILIAILGCWFGWGEDAVRTELHTEDRHVQSEPAREDMGYFKYGLGVGPSADPSYVSVKTLAFGRQYNLLPNIIQQWEAGFWGDASGLRGRKSSGYGGWSAGVNVEAGYLNIQSLWGVELITSPDSMLGGHFQFHQDLFLGVKDQYGCTWGVNYSHMSSAGLEQPNQGRDFVTLRIGIPW